jgi:hypothetical protein
MAKFQNKLKAIDLSKIKRHSVAARKTKSDVGRFAKIPKPSRQFFESLPEFLKATDLKSLATDMIIARKRRRGIIWMMGAHPLKVGLSPIIIDFMKHGYLTHLALNGACVIHDFEIAFWGQTSEEVAETLQDGSFGMVKETPIQLAAALADSPPQMGIGEVIGKYIYQKKPKFAKYSVFYEAYKLGIPVSVHVAIGTDTICQHPEYDAGLWGAKSHIDFGNFCANVKSLNGGGVVINFGSAVILPEVFLKALTVGRNINGKIANFSAANFDMIQHYRPNENVVNRPTSTGGTRYSFTGHHELMLPLLATAIKTYER